MIASIPWFKVSMMMFGAVAVVSAVTLYSHAADADKGKAAGDRFFEMRTYHASKGKLDALNARFRDHTNALFKKHGIEMIGYWMPVDQDPNDMKLIYILAYPSKEAREKSWKDFQDDPDWKKAKAASEADGTPLAAKVESVFMNPTDYSPIK